MCWQGRIASAPATDVDETQDVLPAQPILYQNYPNPFNPTTRIEFYLPQAEFVTLMVFNVSGEKIATLLAEKRNAGRHQVEWNAPRLPSNLYFYRLQIDDFVETRKFVLIK